MTALLRPQGRHATRPSLFIRFFRAAFLRGSSTKRRVTVRRSTNDHPNKTKPSSLSGAEKRAVRSRDRGHRGGAVRQPARGPVKPATPPDALALAQGPRPQGARQARRPAPASHAQAVGEGRRESPRRKRHPPGRAASARPDAGESTEPVDAEHDLDPHGEDDGELDEDPDEYELDDRDDEIHAAEQVGSDGGVYSDADPGL